MKNNRYYTECITAGRANEGLRADWQEQLKMVQNEIGFKYIRFHGIFHDDMAIYDEDENGNPQFYFGYFDKLFDFLQSVNLKPILELGFIPEKLAGNDGTIFWWKGHTCAPADYEKWALLVTETIRHAIERYGMEEIRSWYFEVWNEPNLNSFWHGTQEEYFRLYEYSARAIKAIDPSLRIGGPSTSGADFREDLGYLKAFIAFCAQNRLPVDFFSAHPYPTYWPLDTVGNKRMGYMKATSTIEHLDHIRQIVEDSPYSQAEIHLTEWNSSPSPRDLIHDTPFMAPFILYNIAQNFGKVDSLGFWTFTDVFEENGPGTSEFHGGFGLLNHNGIKKPSYYAYSFLSQLGDEIQETDDKKIISRTGEDYTVILWNFCYYKDSFAMGDRSALSETERDAVFEEKEETIAIRLPLCGEYTVETYKLNRETSAFHNWVKLGAPKYPTREQTEYLKAVSRPQQETATVCGEYTEEWKLQPFETVMLKLKKRHDQKDI